MREAGYTLTACLNWESACSSASVPPRHDPCWRQASVIRQVCGHGPGLTKYPETRHSPVSVRMGTTVSVTVRAPATAVR